MYLNWDVHNIMEVEKEKLVISRNIVDYALKIEGISKIYIEAKKLNDELTNFNEISKAISYTNDDGIEWCLMTNGDKLNLYKTRKLGDLRNKLVLEIQISNNKNLEFLKFFKKEYVKNDILFQELDKISKANKTIQILNEIFSNPLTDFIKYLQNKIPELSNNEIESIFKNIKAEFTYKHLPPDESNYQGDNKILKKDIIRKKSQKSIGFNQIIEVAELIVVEGKDFLEAVKLISQRRNVWEGTIRDKLTRKIGLNTEQFRTLVRNKQDFINFLVKMFPNDEAEIKERLK